MVVARRRCKLQFRQYGFRPTLDPGIRKYVEILHAAVIETYESCEGGQGHAYTEPAVVSWYSPSLKAFNVGA